MPATQASESKLLAGLVPPDQTGQYHPLLRLDHLWRIVGENAPTRWLLGQSIVGRHLLELHFDRELSSRVQNRDEVAPVVARYFYASTAPFHTPSHPEYAAFTQVLAELFRRFPELATLYQQLPQQMGDLIMPTGGEAAFNAKTLALLGPAGMVLHFDNIVQVPPHWRELATVGSQSVLVPADALTEAGLILLHATHDPDALSLLGTTAESASRWCQALLRTIQQRLESRPRETAWAPVDHLQAVFNAVPDESPEGSIASALRLLPDQIQRLIGGAATNLVQEFPQLAALVPPRPATGWGLPVAAEWRPGESLPLASILAVMGPFEEPRLSHPVYGPGYVWRREHATGGASVLEIYPGRRYARGQRPMAELGPASFELVLDLIEVATRRGQGVVQLVSLADEWGVVVSVFPSGEVDVISRRRGGAADAYAFWQAVTAEEAPPEASATGVRPPVPVVDAAARLGYHPTHIKTLIRTGKLIGEKLGRNWYVDPVSLDAFAARRRRRS